MVFDYKGVCIPFLFTRNAIEYLLVTTFVVEILRLIMSIVRRFRTVFFCKSVRYDSPKTNLNYLQAVSKDGS